MRALDGPTERARIFRPTSPAPSSYILAPSSSVGAGAASVPGRKVS
jgi:hypothetical protein